MASSVADRLDRVERKPLKCDLRRTTESFVRAGSLVDDAISKARMTREQAAAHYGVTPSLLARQIQNADNQHLSFQRLWSMPLAFKLELVDVLMSDLRADGAPVEGEMTWRIRRSA
ncbi:MAG TPA: hypothetical protein VD994_03210 [Prosthecobacter sp.]|nr:hypothetical protein [Prosthecobacter sp.]